MSRRAAAGDAARVCAAAVESALAAANVELTIGGEPTFVPRMPLGAEWSSEALGPTKLHYARRLADALLAASLSGGVTLEAPGKLYPGETQPRWSLQLHRRTDGRPLWADRTLLRSDDQPAPTPTLEQARALTEALADELRVDAGGVLAVDDDLAAARGGPAACGFVLPLDERDGTWISERWPYPSGRVPVTEEGRWIGLRLPLGQLPTGALRRALTVEVRGSDLCVFLPPLLFPAFARLLTAIEEVVSRCRLGSIVLAGYPPPPEPGFCVLSITPDPGVLEVNLPPCTTWDAFRDWLDALALAADAAGLCAQKFHYNGRTTGTGGGSHLCFGGPTPERSPFLARPDLIASILRYWQRHPVLSYAFSGQYIGPTSQAPRPDETLPDRLMELDLACTGTARPPASEPQAYLDRLFRHLLSDGGGNTHRTEISVDKLWNPRASNGCLGVLEWRAFETLPDAVAAAYVGLFIRSILTRLLLRPCRDPFIEWGRRLHDRFFLPSFLGLDLLEIVAELRAVGLPFDAAWLEGAWEFRFPRIGELDTPHGRIEVRQALEAWPVLSEQDNGAITSRVVDSSMDRIEVRLADPDAASRGRLLVNGHAVALRQERGVCAAGIRYRAFALPTCYHPHVPAHAPLQLEWVDARDDTVLVAARWHSWRPEADTYPGLPPDAAEAAVRRAERWQLATDVVGAPRPKTAAPPLQGAHEYTLDLRRCSAPA